MTHSMRDPVCGVEVQKDEFKSEWLGCPYWFCSILCKKKFDAGPGLYLSDSARGA
jgi:YHS domain-containing protein